MKYIEEGYNATVLFNACLMQNSSEPILGANYHGFRENHDNNGIFINTLASDKLEGDLAYQVKHMEEECNLFGSNPLNHAYQAT